MTIPDADLMHRLSDLADRVELVQWDLSAPLPPDVAERVDVVEIPHYFTDPRGFDVLRALPNLRYVWLPSAGFDHAAPYLPEQVTLCNGRGVHSTGTAELALALTLAAQRGLPYSWEAQKRGEWSEPEFPSLADRTVVLVGYGSLGRAIEARLEPFEVEIIRVAHRARTDESGRAIHGTDELLGLAPRAEVMILAVPFDAGTQGLVSAEVLAAMPDDALLVNVARGRVVDALALLRELESGRLRAALDVTDPEPLPADNPLWHAPNTIITAHQGGNSTATYPRVAALVRRQIEHLLAGDEPENIVVRGSAETV